MRRKQIIALFLAVAVVGANFLPPAFTAHAETKAEYTKDENIYGVLNADGSMNEMYIVNQFDIKKAGTVTDKGNYDTVTNLTDTTEIAADNNENSFHAEEGYFYYQGTRKKGDLPWNFTVKYYLNGVEIQPQALPGANGNLRIHLTSKKNKEVDPVFYDNFMLQVSLTLDNEKAKNIKAKDSTIADAGTSHQVNFTVMPGKDANIHLEAQVSSFEMSGISIAAIPFSMSVDLPDTSNMTEDMSELTDGISELNDGVGKLKDGVREYVDGVGDFGNGVQKIADNFSSLDNGGKNIVNGSAKVKKGLNKIKQGGSGITSGSGELSETLKGLQKKVSSMDLSGLSREDAGYLVQITKALAENYNTFDNGLNSYVSGVNKLAENYGSFHSGLDQYMDGIDKMGSGIGSLADGAGKLKDGGDKLYTGISELKDGTQEMADGVSDMPNKIDEKLDEMMSDYVKDFTLVSFADKGNEDIHAVQFTITTPEIKRNIKEKEVKEEKKLGFLERLVALFQ